MTLFTIFSCLIYFSAAILLFIYGLNCYTMIWLQNRKSKETAHRQRAIEERFCINSKNAPKVVTQLPIFNEFNVAERVICATCDIAYPVGRHEIQVLDDSNDETMRLIDNVVSELKAKGYLISIVRRSNREGFKAGALKNALLKTDASLVAIFDADFVATKDFLLRTVPYFIENQKLGLVQARWGHLNTDNTLLTRAQAIGMDGHFMIEQSARSWNNLFMNFNGTAGVWRKLAIEDAGGWQCDTLTEDMDLSYRAQLKGWQSEFILDLVVPAEIPEDINAFKSQQFRWAKGSIQTAIKLLPSVFKSQVSIFKKLESFFHLTHYLVHPLMLTLALFALPVLLTFKAKIAGYAFIIFGTIMILATFAPSSLYIFSQKLAYKDWKQKILILPALVTIGVGLAVSNTVGIVQAILGIKTEFVRTPKKGDKEKKKYKVKIPWVTFGEIFMGLYCLISFREYIIVGKYLVGPFLAIYSIGFLFVGLLTILHSFRCSSSNNTSNKLSDESEVIEILKPQVSDIKN